MKSVSVGGSHDYPKIGMVSARGGVSVGRSNIILLS